MFFENFRPPSDELLKKLYKDFQKNIDIYVMGEKVCLVCDRFCLMNTIKLYSVKNLPINNMKIRLANDISLPLVLQQQYDVSEKVPEFAGMLLSNKGLCMSSDKTTCYVCNSCYNSLKSGKIVCI